MSTSRATERAHLPLYQQLTPFQVCRASLQLSACDPAGALIAREPLTLDGRQGQTRLVSQWIPSLPTEKTWHIVISSAEKISLLAYFGTDEGASVAAIPFSEIRR